MVRTYITHVQTASILMDNVWYNSILKESYGWLDQNIVYIHEIIGSLSDSG